MASRYYRSLLGASRRLRAPLFLSTGSPTRPVLTRYNNHRWQSLNHRMYRATTPAVFNSQSDGPYGAPSNFNALEFTGTSLTRNHWGSQDLPVIDRLIEPQVIVHFIEFLLSGTLPNGKKSALPLPTSEEVILLSRPTAEWAAPPHNVDTMSTFDHLSIRGGSNEDPSRMCLLGKNIHYLKSRLWQGLVPVSASRWAEKDLDNPRHFETAFEYLTSVIAVFEYLHIPQVRKNLRDTFNLMSGHLKDAEVALNARRADQSPLSLTSLWEEYIRAKYEVMACTAHAWVISHIPNLQKPLVDGISALPPIEGDQTPPELEAMTSRWFQIYILVKMADLSIWMPMDGYEGYQPSSGIVPGIHNPDMAIMDSNSYAFGFNALSAKKIAEVIKPYEGVDDPKIRQAPDALAQQVLSGAAAQGEMRMLIRGPPPQPPLESWIEKILRAPETSKFGLAIYQMSHKASDEQLVALKEKVEEHLSAWGDSVERADEVKPLLKLHWFDGRELDFADGDINAAKSHFQEITQTKQYAGKFHKDTFLAIDGWSLASYLDPKFNQQFKAGEGFLLGDFKPPHVLAVDALFDPTEHDEHAEEHPGFDGQMRILGNLVWSELYAMLVLQSAELADLWPLAMEHPQKVYTGPTVPGQRESWFIYNSVKENVLGPFLESLKEKNPEFAAMAEKIMMMPN